MQENNVETAERSQELQQVKMANLFKNDSVITSPQLTYEQWIARKSSSPDKLAAGDFEGEDSPGLMQQPLLAKSHMILPQTTAELEGSELTRQAGSYASILGANSASRRDDNMNSSADLLKG